MLKKGYRLILPVVMLVLSSCNPRIVYIDEISFDRTSYGKFVENMLILIDILEIADSEVDPDTNKVSLPGLSGTYTSTKVPDFLWYEITIDCNLYLQHFEVSPGIKVSGTVSVSASGIVFDMLYLDTGTINFDIVTNGTIGRSCNVDLILTEGTGAGKIVIDGKNYYADDIQAVRDYWFSDRYENDDSPDTASQIQVGETQARTFHLYPDVNHRDIDWISLSVTEGTTYTIITEETSVDIYIKTMDANTDLYLCDHDGYAIAHNDDDYNREGVYSQYSKIVWTADFTGIVYICVEESFGGLGDYQLTVTAE